MKQTFRMNKKWWLNCIRCDWEKEYSQTSSYVSPIDQSEISPLDLEVEVQTNFFFFWQFDFDSKFWNPDTQILD